MNHSNVSYVTFHRVRFAAPVSASERSFAGPSSAGHWLCGPRNHMGPNGLPTRVSDEWTGVAFYQNRDAAEAVMDNPAAALPFVSDATEAWHGLLCPFSHRGDVNWFGALEDAARFVPVAQDPGGTMVVMTSAGYNTLPPDALQADLSRRAAFFAGVIRVQSWFRTLPDNFAAANFATGPLGRDGITFSAWRNDAAMALAAYRSGVHREEMDRGKAEVTFDRSSFTRARIMRSTGTWDGAVLA